MHSTRPIQRSAHPQPGVGYAGMTPIQRRWFLEWLARPGEDAPLAFMNLYVAYLEVNLFETVERSILARKEIAQLLASPTWQTHTELMRAWLLGAWLAQDGPSLTAWPEGVQPSEGMRLAGLGLQAQLGVPLHPQQALDVMDALALNANGTGTTPDLEVMKHRLGSLAATLGAEILAYCLAQMPAEALAPRPWRCSHRDLRVAFPQPDIAPILRPLLLELAAQDPGDNALADESTPDEAESLDDSKWTLTLEFQESRSQYFVYAMTQAKKQPTFSQIMDENRKLVYRITFNKSRLRHFWRLWEYVNNWSGTRVYVNGKELDSWKLWPDSPYLK